MAQAGRKAIPWLLATFHDFERLEPAPRSPAETRTCTVVYRRTPLRAPQPRAREKTRYRNRKKCRLENKVIFIRSIIYIRKIKGGNVYSYMYQGNQENVYVVYIYVHGKSGNLGREVSDNTGLISRHVSVVLVVFSGLQQSQDACRSKANGLAGVLVQEKVVASCFDFRAQLQWCRKVGKVCCCDVVSLVFSPSKRTRRISSRFCLSCLRATAYFQRDP